MQSNWLTTTQWMSILPTLNNNTSYDILAKIPTGTQQTLNLQRKVKTYEELVNFEKKN
jgi:hypothetical protein